MGRRFVVGLVAAVTAGALLGAVARVMMRVVALAAGEETGFSVAGTAGILLAFVVLTLPGALLAALWRGRGRWMLLAVGSLVLCLVGTGILTSDLEGVTGLSPWRWIGVGAAALGVYAAILAVPLLALRVIAAGLRERPAPVAATAVPPDAAGS